MSAQGQAPARPTRLSAPTLTTARLTLRHHMPQDLPRWTDYFATEDTRFMGGPLDAQTAWHFLASDICSWQFTGHGGWAIDLDGTFIGQTSVTKPPAYAETEIGWFLFPEHRGHGYALEAATAARAFAYDTLKLPTLVSYIDPDNAASIALAERLGATRDHTANAPEPGDLVYRHPAPEALS